VQQLQIVSLIIRADVIFAKWFPPPAAPLDALLLAPHFTILANFLQRLAAGNAQLDQRMRSAQITARRYCDISSPTAAWYAEGRPSALATTYNQRYIGISAIRI
jgi:hypothetical protein